MSTTRTDAHVARTVHRLVAGGAGGSIELGRTLAGEAYGRLVSAPAGRGVPRERFLVVAPTFGQLFTALAGCFGPDDEPLGD